jgi:hypothetical protein
LGHESATSCPPLAAKTIFIEIKPERKRRPIILGPETLLGLNVRYGSKVAVGSLDAEVRFADKSGHS